jgi:hypothetical protein
MQRSRWFIAAQAVLLVFLAKTPDARCEVISYSVQPTGLITTRLSAKELEKWKAIEQVVFAEDANHQWMHPTLVRLWEWAETSGHAIYVEFFHPGSVATCTAGHFMIEQFDPMGERHVAVILLNLMNIEQAYVGRETKRDNGLVPFLWLDREERYAEVLGHELAHAVHILTDLERTRMVEEVVQQTNQMLLSRDRRLRENGVDFELGRLLSKRDDCLQKLEAQAEAMEKVIWEELSGRKSERGKLANLAGK